MTLSISGLPRPVSAFPTQTRPAGSSPVASQKAGRTYSRSARHASRADAPGRATFPAGTLSSVARSNGLAPRRSFFHERDDAARKVSAYWWDICAEAHRTPRTAHTVARHPDSSRGDVRSAGACTRIPSWQADSKAYAKPYLMEVSPSPREALSQTQLTLNA